MASVGLQILRRALSRQRRLLWPLLALISGAAAASAAVGAESLPGVDDRWRRYRSPSFELYSRTGDMESRAFLYNLELLRTVFLERFRFVERAPQEITVYAFRSIDDFFAYTAGTDARSRSLKGFYLLRRDRAVISLAPVDDADRARQLIFHEYGHHLLRAAEQRPPPWYNEGVAELLAATRVAGGQIEVGRALEGRIGTLRDEKLLPLETLFAIDQQSPMYRSGTHTGLFYAQSWALLHYWHFGQSNLPAGAAEKFLRVAGDERLAGKADLRGLFRESFGMDYPEMLRRLETYVESGTYRYARQPVPKLEPAKSYDVRAVPRDEIHLRLAELALRVQRSAAAKLVLLHAIKHYPDDPRPFEALGMDALIDRDERSAVEYWERALAAGSRNPSIYRELASLESRAWFRQFNFYFRLPAERAVHLRERLMRAIEAAPLQSSNYEMLAWVEAFAPEAKISNVNLVQERFAQLREQARTALALAMVRVRLEQRDQALAILDVIDSLEPDEWTIRAAETVRAKLENRPPRHTTPKRPANPSGLPILPKMPPPVIELP